MLAGEIVNEPEAAFHFGKPFGVEVERFGHGSQGGARLRHIDCRGIDEVEHFLRA